MELYDNLMNALEQMKAHISKQPLQGNWIEQFEALVRKARENSRVLVMGEFNAGKSSFLNALLEREWLATDVTPATAVVTILQYGEYPSLEAVMKDGRTASLDFELLHRISAEGDPKVAGFRAQVKYLIVRLPSDLLKTITLVDTPGLNTDYEEHTQSTHAFLQEADDVIWLFRYGAVGRMSEIQSIEQIKQYGILPLGVVNAIDLHYEQTDEDLDELLLRELHKLRPYVRDLIGVSSLDALEGVTEDDAEKKEWGNFAALAAPLSRMQQLKLHRVMRNLIRYLESFEEKLNEQIREHKPNECAERLRLLLKEEIHAYHNDKNKLHKKLSELQAESQALNLWSTPPASFEAAVEEMKRTKLKSKKEWVQLSDKFVSLITFHNNNVTLHNNSRVTVVVEHKKAVGTGIGRLKQLFTSKRKLVSIERMLTVLAAKRDDCENSSEAIRAYQSSFNARVTKLTGQLESEINALKGQYEADADRQIRQYKERIDNLKLSHEEDVLLLEQYRFLAPLIEHLEHIRIIADTAGDPQNEVYIQQFQASLQTIIERLHNLAPDDVTDAYAAAIRELEAADAAEAVEGKLPYSLQARVPEPSDILTCTPHVPGPLTLNTTYLRPYWMPLVFLGVMFFYGWTYRDMAMGWIDKLQSAKKAETVQAPRAEERKTLGAATIKAYELNIRSEPDLNAPKVGSVKQGESYAVLAENNGWFQIGEHAWISGKTDYVSFEPNP